MTDATAGLAEMSDGEILNWLDDGTSDEIEEWLAEHKPWLVGLRIKIGGEWQEVDSAETRHYQLPMLKIGQQEWYVADSRDTAGEAAVEHWRDLMKYDPEEFRCLIGDETLIAWACGQRAGPGTYCADSVEDWLENAVAQLPEEHFANHDGNEQDVEAVSRDLAEELDIAWNENEEGEVNGPVAYRHN